jgi:hypothetical protein
MTTTDISLIELIEALPPEARNEVRDFVEFLIAKQRRDQAKRTDANGWPEGFFDLAGSISDPTFVRPPQGEAEVRLPFE